MSDSAAGNGASAKFADIKFHRSSQKFHAIK